MLCVCVSTFGCGESSDGKQNNGGNVEAGPSCTAAQSVPFAWTVSVNAVDVGGADAGTSAGTPCIRFPDSSLTTTTCKGTATVDASSGATVLALNDQSTFTWVTDPQTVSLPTLGAYVDIEYTHSEGSCGGACQVNRSSIRLVRGDGALVFAASTDTPSLLDALKLGLGADLEAQEACTEALDHPCYQSGTNVLSNYQVLTEPPQTLKYESTTNVVTPSGSFDVAFKARDWQDLVPDPSAQDCGNDLTGGQYAVSRTGD
jgi:hypothetical protein